VRKLVPGLLVVALAAAFSVWAYPQLPAQVATHFNLHGQPNGWSSRLVAALFAPALGIALALVFTVLPRIDPRGANYAKFGPTYWTIANAVLVFVAALHVLSLGKALGWDVNMTRVASLGVGGLLVVLGNLMTRIRPNWFVGIRTPWTLSSDTVWRRTHRFGGWAFMIAGLCVAFTALLASPWALYGAIGVAGAAALGSVVYSYVVWKAEQDTGPST
jgi:immunity protein, SdpI family